MTLYIGTAELKNTLNITGTASDVDVGKACDAASRLIEEYKRFSTGRSVRYYSTVETRYYTPEYCRDLVLSIDDTQGITQLSIDRTKDYTYSEDWTVHTDYVLEPANNPLESKPQRTIVRNTIVGRPFPDHPQSVRVTGTFGWSTVPTLVQQAAAILAARLYSRRNSPMGILTVGLDAAAVRLSKTDPDVVQLLDAVDSDVPRSFA